MLKESDPDLDQHLMASSCVLYPSAKAKLVQGEGVQIFRAVKLLYSHGDIAWTLSWEMIGWSPFNELSDLHIIFMQMIPKVTCL